MTNSKKIHNFSAGPSILSTYAIEKSIADLQNFSGTGLSAIEVSHRGKEFQKVMDDACELVRSLLDVPSNYDILFLQGGASTQFYQIPMNFMKNKAVYLNTGTWSKKAIKEAKAYGEVIECASSAKSNFNYIPTEFSIDNSADYFHCTSNNTIFGTQIQEFPDSPISLICDMSSDIFSRPIEIEKFDMIYAGAQKNMGPAGVTLVIIKKDLYQNTADRHVPTMLKYDTHAEAGSMYNTPPVFAILASMHNLKWLKDIGGVKAIQNINEEKANILYSAIDESPYFTGTAELSSRSKMNVCFVFKPEHQDLEDKFNELCKTAGISGIKGHRSVGGYRASIYNAMPTESVQVLADIIRGL